jgi:beta-carotene 3-hydroxylase
MWLTVVLPILLLLGTVALMEGVAWLVHRYLLHGPLWFLHRTHHYPQKGFWEANDLIVLVYAAASAALVMHGLHYGSLLLWPGLGIALYGLLYFWLHDIVVHQRVRLRLRPRLPYVERLVRAHKIHHKHLHKSGSQAFGFLYAAPRYRPR